MKELRRILARQPEVALGIAVFAGLALGAGWLPIPALPSLGSILPSSAAKTATPAATTAAAAAPGPAVPSPSMWD